MRCKAATVPFSVPLSARIMVGHPKRWEQVAIQSTHILSKAYTPPRALTQETK
jgi:hypothetical protein